MCPRRQNAAKNNAKSRFSSGVIKKSTHAPDANHDKGFAKTAVKRTPDSDGAKFKSRSATCKNKTLIHPRQDGLKMWG